MAPEKSVDLDTGEAATLEGAPPESAVCTRAACVARRYDICTILGRGGMGTVWLARDRALGVRVAVKFLNAGEAASAEARVRFALEGQVLAELSTVTEHVVRPIERGVHEGQPFLAMELLVGETLAALLARAGPLAAAPAAAIVAQVASALTAAHRLGVVHRDLKLENVILCVRDGELRVKVLDFGIAKRLGPSLEAQATAAMGTLRYMSPEQMRGLPIDHRTDLWALGVVAFHLITGRPPFDGRNVYEIARRTCEEPPPSAALLEPSLAPAVDAFFTRALDRDPAGRFQSAEEMARSFASAVGAPFRRSLAVTELPPEPWTSC